MQKTSVHRRFQKFREQWAEENRQRELAKEKARKRKEMMQRPLDDLRDKLDVVVRNEKLADLGIELFVGDFRECNVQGFFEVRAYSCVYLRVGGFELSHSLWFCDCEKEGEFRWYETAFTSSPLVSNTRQGRYHLAPEDGMPCLRAMDIYQRAWPLTAVDDADAFVERWLEWAADAYEGKRIVDAPDRIEAFYRREEVMR